MTERDRQTERERHRKREYLIVDMNAAIELRGPIGDDLADHYPLVLTLYDAHAHAADVALYTYII